MSALSPKLRIVFMGTPAFARTSLAQLHAHYDVVGVFTAASKPQGRGRQLAPSPVQVLSEQLGIACYSFEDLTSDAPLRVLAQLRPDLGVVLAFVKLPSAIWSFFPMGCLNLHASLLPDYRGAAPIAWAIIKGETRTGLSTFFINDRIDTGDLLLQKEIPIYPDDTQDSLGERMQALAAAVILQTVAGICSKKLPSIAQPQVVNAPKAPKLQVAHAAIDWTDTAIHIRNHVRGLCSKPGAWTLWEGIRCKIFTISICTERSLAPGHFVIDGNSLLVGSGTEALCIEELQLAGRKRMFTKDFLRGRDSSLKNTKKIP